MVSSYVFSRVKYDELQSSVSGKEGILLPLLLNANRKYKVDDDTTEIVAQMNVRVWLVMY